MIRGSVLLAACVALSSCASDPTAEDAGKPYAISASPAVVFVNQGAVQTVDLALLDELGGQIPESWSVAGTGPAGAFSVAFDSTFRPVYNPDGSLTLPEKQTEVRVYVTGLTGAADTLDVSAGGKTMHIPVFVVPTGFSPTIAPADAVFGDTVTVTMPAGYSLLPTASFTSAAASPAYVASIAPDGSSAQIVLTPGSDALLTVVGAEISFLPGTPLTLPTTTTVTRPIQDDPTAAPPIALPAVGSSVTFTDPVGAGADQFYQFTVTGTETVQIGLAWAGGADVDMLICNAACDAIVNTAGATGANPESTGAMTLAAGTYNLWLNIYDAHDDPPVAYTVTVENVAP